MTRITHIVALSVVFLHQLVGASWLVVEDRVCDPAKLNRVLPYSGFRIHRQYTYGMPVLHHMRVSHCDAGFVAGEALVPTERSVDVVWGQTFCIRERTGAIMSSDLCYRLVRHKKYAGRLFSVYVPHAVVGGLFRCPSNLSVECTNENSRPVLPVLADLVSQQWSELQGMRYVHRVPYLYTPSYADPRYPRRLDKDLAWAKGLDVDEKYQYSVLESLRFSNAVNKLLNVVGKALSLDPQLLPWERDPVSRDLEMEAPAAVCAALVANMLDKNYKAAVAFLKGLD